jgi:hypothetical protein
LILINAGDRCGDMIPWAKSMENVMRRRCLVIALGLGILLVAGNASAQDDSRPATIQTPQSIRVQHEQILAHLGHIAAGKGPGAIAADRALIFLKSHYVKEEGIVLPPLALLGKLTNVTAAEARAAIAMADRVKAMERELHEDHVQITSLINELLDAGKKSRDAEMMRLATRVAAQSLNDIEINQPAVILIGEYLRARISGATVQ